jgi:hypothetical protein
MKTIKSLIALAVMASLTLNAFNAHSYALGEAATGVSTDASGNISVRIIAAGNMPATKIAVSFQVPQIADGKLDWSRATPVDVPAMAQFSRLLVPTPLQAHHRWVYVVTGVDKDNTIKAFFVY